jgi:hypothetical protein
VHVSISGVDNEKLVPTTSKHREKKRKRERERERECKQSLYSHSIPFVFKSISNPNERGSLGG